MAKRVTKVVRRRPVAASRSVAKTLPKVASGELSTLLDHIRYATSRFNEAGLVFAHGTSEPMVEAAFLVCEAVHLHPEQLETFAGARVTAVESKAILDLVGQRITTRKPAAYLVNKTYLRGLPFYVDERVIVPRSFIGEILDSPLFGENEQEEEAEEAEASLIGDPERIESVLDLCTGSGCLAVLAARHFPNARIDAVDLSKDALEVARRNVAEHGLEERIMLSRGDLFTPLGGDRYDLIICNPPYVDAEGMAGLPPECRAEPKLALDGGKDGLDIVRRIVTEAGDHLTAEGGLLCEIGRGRKRLEEAFPHLPFLWLDSQDSEGEVFWIAASDLG